MVVWGDPHIIKTNLSNDIDYGYEKCGRKCDSCNNFVYDKISFVCFAIGTECKVRRDSTCNARNIIYSVYCKKINKQGVGSCIEWKSWLRNQGWYKKLKSCS